MANLWIEAESFDNLGGWVVDSQSVPQVGSAYIMAHGMGVPVMDATATRHIPESGRYAVWARTRDWSAPWKRGNPAGQFKIIINETELPETLGTNGPGWGWQQAGEVELIAGNAQFALHDLTGFDGRCDALYLTTASNEVPPDNGGELVNFRREKSGIRTQDAPEEYDLVVAGGGMAGVCTAVSAALSGAKVLLIQDRGVLGGCNSSEVRVPLGGRTHCGQYPELGNIVDAISPIYGKPSTFEAKYYEDTRKESIFRLFDETQCKLVLNESVVSLERASGDPQKIAAVITRSNRNGQETRYKAKLFADCTGDAVLARMMGAETMYGREAESTFNESLAPEEDQRQVMGHSILWDSEKLEMPVDFPDIDWGIEFTEKNCYYVCNGDWECEAGQNRDQVTEAEYIRDYGMMTTYANWSFLKNHSKRKDEWANRQLRWVACVGGKRESYRAVGDYVLNQNDIEQATEFSDGTAVVNWNIDLHFPDPENESKFNEPFKSCAYHRGFPAGVQVPYRCLYARDIKNLFLGGRHISTSHVAFAAVRVMRTLGMLGEVIGMATGICIKNNATPRDVYTTYFDQLKILMAEGVKVPTYHPGGHDSETYHFKDIGHIQISPNRDEKRVAENLERIQEVNERNRINTISPLT